jgi:copper(I)-binding protein
MLIGITKPVAPGDRVDLVLEFDDGSSAMIHASVRQDPGMKVPAGS